MSTEPTVAAEVPAQPAKPANPLSKFFRTPAIYISLPSGGRWWPEGTIDMPDSGELPVYPLTNRDEIILRTPDALISGQGVIEVIHSCLPNIKNAWMMPSIDVDAVLIAMRIASYGHSMDFDSVCPHCKAEHTYAMDLRSMMDSVRSPDYDQAYETAGLKILFQPQAYFDINRTNKTTFELTKMQQALDALTDAADPDGLQKISAISSQVQKVSELTHQFLAAGTTSITLDSTGEVITSKDFITEFYSKIPTQMFKDIQKALETIQEPANMKPVPVSCQSCNGEIQLNILFDYANFFVIGS